MSVPNKNAEDHSRIKYITGILTLLKEEAANPTLTPKGFRGYVYKMCDLALQKKESV